ncbi:MAG: CDP-alcohol phosphatidyltransferase family protein, partial [Candidatus Njordarchaeales archaeon]
MNLKSEEKLINVPNMLTLLNLILGFSAILYAKIDPAISFILIFTATVADALDGLAARVLKQTSKIGKELDSIADICSFGIAPAYLLLTIDFRIEAYIASIIYVCG